MGLAVLLVTFTVLMVLGVPVAMTMIGASIAFILMDPTLSLANIASKLFGGIAGQSLLALPLYVIAGEIMNSAGITRRLFNFPLSFIGHIKGGLAHVNIAASLLFAGMSGSAIADTAGLGKIEIKAMEDEGYDKGFSAAITGASSSIGPIFPPSTTMITFATIAEVSIARLFLGGIIPGILMTLIMMIHVAIVAKMCNLPSRPKATWKEKLVATREAILPMLTPVIIIGGIITGIATATETGALAVIYSMALSFYYERYTLPEIIDIVKGAAITTVKICFIVMGSALFGYVVTMAKIPDLVSTWLVELGTTKWMILILINIILLIMGCFLSITSSQMIITPILVVLASIYDIDLVHLGVFMTLNLTIGLLTPPVGWNLYILSDVTGLPFEKVVKAILPLLIPLAITLLLITYFDQLVLWLPNLLLG